MKKEPEENLFAKKTLNRSEFWRATGYNLIFFVALWVAITVLFFVLGAITEEIAPGVTGWDQPVVLILWGLIAILFIFIQSTLLNKRLKDRKRH